MQQFYQHVSDILDRIIKDEFGVSLPHPLWELPSRPEFGDLSSMAAMKLASQLKKNPH